MTNSEVRNKKQELIRSITNSIRKFESETGLMLDDISINKMDVSTMDDPQQTFLKIVQIRLVEKTKWSGE